MFSTTTSAAIISDSFCTVYHSGQYGNAQNCAYPYSGTGTSPEELKQLSRYDHTFIQFKTNYRCKENFLETAAAALDNDNDHSDNPADWVGVADVPRLIPDVPCVIYTSRHHMKQKGERGPRPRFHAVFFISAIKSAKEYSVFLAKVQSLFPFFDGKALDAGRFFFGNPDAEVFTFPGTKTLTEFIAELEAERSVTDTPVEESHQSFSIPADSIPEGSRNSTLSHEAGKILKRWGDTAEAYQMCSQRRRR